MSSFIWVCLGGAVGSGARYLLGTGALALLGPRFPMGTLAVNLIGSFLVSFVMSLALAGGMVSPQMRLFLVTGLLGGFTTYSSFTYETLHLAQEGQWSLVTVNLTVTVVGCLLAGLAGMRLAAALTAGNG